MPDPTPGQIAYENYWPALGTAPPVPWSGLSPVVHRAWEAAALAVRTAYAQTIIDGWQTKGVTWAAIVEEINAREAASLEALRRAVEENTDDA